MLVPPFPAQFFILLGIDIFLGEGILTVLFDEHFPTALPYVLEASALFGFVQLVLSSNYLPGYPAELQFYYCVAYAIIAAASVLATNAYLALVRGKPILGGWFAIAGSAPAVLSLVFFASAYVNDVVVPLPLLPLMPLGVMYVAFVAATAMIVAAMVIIVRRRSE
jgi:hypothetical protein